MTPAEHAATVQQLEATVRRGFPVARPGDRLTATRRQEAQDALRQIVALAERATELERDRDAWRNNCLDAQESLAVRREKQVAAEARAEQLETALRVLLADDDMPNHWDDCECSYCRAVRACRAALDGGTATPEPAP